MALETTVKYGLQRLAQVFQDYAFFHGWRDDCYKVYVRLKPLWGRILVLLVAKTFPEKDGKAAWMSVWNHLQRELKDEPALLESIDFSVLTFDQVAEGGAYAIPRTYVELDDVLQSGPLPEWDEPSPFADGSRD
jgi:hypothetical protein